MGNQRVGILHPGKMGITIAASAKNSGNDVYWASEGRSRPTHLRAAGAGLTDAGTLARLCKACSLIVSVCPPEFAEEAACQVLRCSFRGIYVDANAISPERAQRLGRQMRAGGIDFVDGGVIGPPAVARGTTWLCLSGPSADAVASCFSAGPLETELLGDRAGRASALKMCFAAQTKGAAALLCSVLAAAQELGVLDDLRRQWARHGPSFSEAARGVTQASPKAWRFVSEMQEIAATFQAAGLPPEFHRACAEIYRRLSDFKDTADPQLDDILRAAVRHREAAGGNNEE